MKKFCNRITKQQWRVTVPNINTSLFRRTSPNGDGNASKNLTIDKIARISSGSYDLQEAQSEFDRACKVPNALIIEANLSDSGSENYEDARAMSDKQSVGEVVNDVEDSDMAVYADVETKVESKCLTENNSKYEYDVPKISFSFFERNANGKAQEKSERPTVEDEASNQHKSEIKIQLDIPETEQIESEVDAKILSKSDSSLPQTDSTDIKIEIKSFKSIENFPVNNIRKSGSDPNIPFREKKQDDEEFYKVPGIIKRYRLSQSLNDFNIENIETISSANSSIEHISCSQVIVQKSYTEPCGSAQNSASLDYCKARSKLPMKIRKITLLRKPRNKAVDTWINLRTKVGNILTEHAAKQRVGAFGERDKLSIDIEGMYKNSKNKCKRVFKNTGKLFNKNSKKDRESVDSDTSSCIVKNDAFFAKVHIQPCDIEYKFNSTELTEYSETNNGSETSDNNDVKSGASDNIQYLTLTKKFDDERKDDFDFNTIKSAFRRSKLITEGQNGFDDLRRYVKQGGDFCKELSTILQERSDAELQYAKSLSKLSGKLARACRDGVGGLNEAWRMVASELETRAEAHRVLGAALSEDAARPLRNLNENQHRCRKQAEAAVDKSARNLADWRGAEAKSKKHSHTCARENEKLQDALLDARISRSTGFIQLAHLQSHKTISEKENAKLEGKKRKAEDAVKKADIEYYTLCVRSERARLEWESAASRGAKTFQSLEEERLHNLKSTLTSYINHNNELGPRLIEATERLRGPISQSEPSKDLSTFINLKNSSQQISEQLLPDFYCEHITLAMNRERRKQALVKLLHLIRQDIERERKSKNGLENLSKAIQQTPNFGAEDSQQNVTEKLYHMKSMLTYLEGARYKVQSALGELDSRPKTGHPLASHITVTRDKSGLQQSVLKVPQWLRDEWIEVERSPVSDKSIKSEIHINDIDLTEPDWNDRGTADGNSNQLDSDFDEFSSQGSSTGIICNTEESPVQPIAQCRALYSYTPNLPDELTLKVGDRIAVYRQQDDGWWLGECNGSVGIFPATYVETVAV